jgi:hypothetical protein
MIMQSRKRWIFLFGLLLVINLGTLMFFWMGHLREQRMPVGPHLKERMAEELNFDENQRKQLDIFVKDHQDKSAQIRIKIESAKINFYQLNSSDSVKNVHFIQLKSVYGELDQLNFGHFKDIRSICKEDQLLKFDELMQQIFTSGNFGFTGKNPRPR